MKELVIESPAGYEIDKEKSTFEKIVFKETPKNITERIKTVEDACKELGENDEEVKDYRALQKANVSYKVLDTQGLVVVIKALNEGWTGDWSNSNEYKYLPYWNMKNLSLDGVDSYYASDYSGTPASRLYFKNRELAEYAAKQFINLYKNYLK